MLLKAIGAERIGILTLIFQISSPELASRAKIFPKPLETKIRPFS